MTIVPTSAATTSCLQSDHRRPRLLFVTGGYRLFGKERVVLTLIRGLHARGYDIHCLTNAWSDDAYRRELAAIGVPFTAAYLGWFYPRNPAWTWDSIRNAPRAFATGLGVYRRFRPDLVLHDSTRTLTQIGWRSVGKNVMIVQDYASTRTARARHRLLDWQVAAYVPCSNDVRQNLLSAGVPDRKIHPVENPADFDPTIRIGNRPADPTELAVGIVGQVTERKGHHVVIEAMAQIRERHPDLRYRLKVFGDGPVDYLRRVRAIAETRGVAGQIDWCGYRSCKDDIYPEVDFTLVPTITPDPAPLASIEPAVYGKPTIATTVGGLPEIVRDGVTGYLVPASDPAALANRMVQLLSDPPQIRALGEAAFRDYRMRFDAGVFVNKYEIILNNCIKASHPSR